jgi:hypothetical protein
VWWATRLRAGPVTPCRDHRPRIRTDGGKPNQNLRGHIDGFIGNQVRVNDDAFTNLNVVDVRSNPSDCTRPVRAQGEGSRRVAVEPNREVQKNR